MISGSSSGGKSGRAKSKENISNISNISNREVDLLRQKITDLVGESPEKAATILSDWIQKSVQAQVRKKTAR